MEKNCRMLKRLKYLSLPMGLLMFELTRDSFGISVSFTLGCIAAIAFRSIVVRELSRQVTTELVKTIEEAIRETADVKNIVEIQKINGGLIARIYLVNAAEKTALINNAIRNKIENCSLKNYLFAMQMTNLSTPGAIKEAREVLNRQLLEELTGKKRNEAK